MTPRAHPAEVALGDVWSSNARHWSSVTPPLRPSAEDLAVYRRVIEEAGLADPTVLVLGVTPELCVVGSECGGRVIAMDRSGDMIRSIWPGRLGGRDSAVLADWRWMPLTGGSVGVVVGDGIIPTLSYPSGHVALCAEIRRVLAPRGRCVIRCFTQIERPETPQEVFDALARGSIGAFAILKWRLAMALQPDPVAGVAVRSVWNTLREAWEDPELLAERHGWPAAEVRTIVAYRDADTRYTFPTLAEHRELFAANGFAVVRVSTPSYELGERCPTLVLEPLAGEGTRA